MEGISFYNVSVERVAEALESDLEKGLSREKIKAKQKTFGKNLLPKKEPLSKFKIVLDQIKSPLIYILLIAGVIVLFFKEYTDAIVIFGAVFLNTMVGFIQESKASEALDKLKEIIKIKAQVVRENKRRIINQKELVPGDLVIIEPGNKIPADGRLVEANNLRVNEAPLTGEWLAAQKKLGVLPKETPLADRDNMLYMGSMVESGRGRMIVTKTGSETEMGKIAALVRETKEEKTPLQKRLAHFSSLVGIIIALISFLIFLGGLLRGAEVLKMFETAVAVAVAAIPEGLPVAMTVILALGMQRILKRKGLVRKLSAAEALGSTSVACTDKTLTLTEGKMVVGSTFTLSKTLEGKNWAKVFKKEKDQSQELVMRIASLSNEAFIENPDSPKERWKIRGRPTDKALVLAGAKVNLRKDQLEEKYPKIKELPFSAERKFIATLHFIDKKKVLYLSGAPEKVLELSSKVYSKKEEKITKKKRKNLNQELEDLTKKGLRVIAVAYKEVSGEGSLEEECKDLTFVGFIGLKDPLRKEAKQAINLCKKAGMRPILVTGDHVLTAKAIAKEIGLKIKKENVIEGKELDKMDDKELLEVIKKVEVYARVEPRHKLRIVRAWQELGEVVAMTGDGVNDTPALKKADIGVGLGSGTDVAKEVSDLVLLTDNFNIIVAAVEEGRAILDNIRKVITYLLSDSFSETILIGASIVFGWPLPVTAVQILWVNLIEDSLPGIALAFEPKEKGIMRRKPQPKKLSLLTKEMKAIIFIIGFLTDLVLLGLFFWLFGKFGVSNLKYIQTMIFASLGIDSLFYVFSCKNLRKNIWDESFLNNKFLIGGWVFGILFLLIAIYGPLFQVLLDTVPLGIYDWLILSALGIIEIVSIEAAKYYFIVRHETEEI